MADFCELWPGGPRFAQAEHFKLGTDCVLLADFVNTASARRGIDLGCASGAISLLLLTRSPRLHMTGLELVPEAVELARANMAENALTERADMLCGDIRRVRELFAAGSFDLVAANPPSFPVGHGRTPSDAARAAARGETLSQLALQWTLRDKAVTSALIGASRAEQITENVAALSLPPLTDEELAQIDAALALNEE